MEKILSFGLFEAMLSSHFNKRFRERIVELKEVSIDTLQREGLEKEIENLIGSNWKDLLIISIIKNTEKRILQKVKSISFPADSNVSVPISFLFLDFNGKTYPIEITSYSSKDGGEKSFYKGSQIWASVSADTAWTLKIFGKTKNLDSIESNMKSGVSERYRKNKFQMETPGEDFKVRFSWNPETGSFVPDDGEEIAPSLDYDIVVPERKTISPGDTIGLLIKGISPDRITRGRIQEITNMGEIKDKQKAGNLSDVAGVKLSFLPSNKEERIISNGREIPFVSTLKPGSVVEIDGVEYSVLGSEGGKPLVTSEPSIINSGKVQTWVQKSTSS
jgi:hypothetical protein